MYVPILLHASSSIYNVQYFFTTRFYLVSSRFDSCITFGLPDHQTRQEIAASYAKHLSESDLLAFASVTEE